jgi:hypothetical protein
MKPIYGKAMHLPYALEGIPGAIRGTPLTEPDRPGPLFAEEVWRFRDEASEAPTLIRPQDQKYHLPGSFDDELEDDSERSGGGMSVPVFWTPPGMDKDDVYKLLDQGRSGEYLRQAKLLGVDAFGYYASFHQRTYQWGVYIPLDGIAAVAKQALSALNVDLDLKFEIAWSFIRAHELFHYAADCGIGQLELLLDKPIWWPARDHESREELRQLEEELATGYSLRHALHLPGYYKVRGAYQGLRDFCKTLPPGYREGHLIAGSRHKIENRMLDHAQGHWWLASGRDGVQAEMHHLYPAFREYDLDRCPIHLIDPPDLGGAVLIQRIERISEMTTFLKQLHKYPKAIVRKWEKTKQLLSSSVLLKGLDFKPWPPLGRDYFSVRVDSSMRAHLRFDAVGGAWFAEEFGPHTKMGHG